MRVFDSVMLRDYSIHLDWSRHAGQVAIIEEIHDAGIHHPLEYTHFIRWPDGESSSAPVSALIPVNGLERVPVTTATQAMHGLGRVTGNTTRTLESIGEIVTREIERRYPLDKPVETKQYRNFSEFLKAKDKTK